MELLLTPMPKSVVLGKGVLKGKLFCGELPEGVLYATIGKELGRTGDVEISFLPGRDEMSETKEGYSIEIERDRVSVFAAGAAGHFYGAVTLCQLVRQFGEEIPCMKISDAPEMEFRSGAMEFGHGLRFKMDWCKSWIRRLAMQKANYIYLGICDIEGWLPGLEAYYPDSMHAAQAKELNEYARSYNIRLIPSVSIHGHWNELLAMQRYSDCREVMEGEESAVSNVGNSICPNNPRALEVLRTLIDAVIDCFSPELILVGGDEIYSAGGDLACRGAKAAIGKTGIILSNFIRFRNYVEGKGVKMGIWGDMLISISGENRYDGNIEESRYRESNLYLLNELRRNTVIFDWWYVGGSENSQKFFSENGFQVVACTSTHACMMHFASPQQQINMWKLFKGACKYKLYGCMVTDWINMYGYQTEQTYFNHGAGMALAWRGCDGNFIDGVTREEFERAFMLQGYNTRSGALR